MMSPGCARSSTAWSGWSAWAFSSAAMAAPKTPAARIAAGTTRRRSGTYRSPLSHRLRFDEHPALHLHVHGVTEPGAVVPVDAGLIHREGDGSRRLRGDFHLDAVVHDREAVGEVFDRVDVGDVDGDLVALLDLELLEAEGRGGRGHVDTYDVAVADDLGIRLQIDAVGFRLLDRVGKHRIGPVPDRDRVDLGAVNDGRVVRFRKARTVVDENHLIAGNVDELVVFRLERPDVQEAVLRKLVQRDQPFSIGLLGLAHRRVVVAGLVVDIDLLDDRIDLLALECPFREIDAPFADLAVQEQRGIGV